MSRVPGAASDARPSLHSSGGTRSRPVLARGGVELLFVVVLLSLQFARFPFRTHPITSDIRFFVYFSGLVADGGVPHVDYFDNKTQLTPLLGGLFIKAGELAGVDRLVANRVGFLAVTVLGGVLLFAIQRRIWPALPLSGWVGIAPYVGLPLIGLMPAIGAIPKLLMAVAASGAAVAADRRRWVLAGLVATIAPCDWQIGGLVAIGVLVAALAERPGHRLTALGGVVLGGAIGTAAFLLFFVLHGALDIFVRQAVVASAFRGGDSLGIIGSIGRSTWPMELQELVADWPRRWEILVFACLRSPWLLVVAGAGAIVLAYRLFAGGAATRPMFVVLATYHYGLLAFSAIDFQYLGDAFPLMHTAALLAGLTLNQLYSWIADWSGPRAMRMSSARWAPSIVALAMIALSSALWIEPSRLRLIQPPYMAQNVTLDEQRTMASQFVQRFAHSKVVYIGASDLLALGGLRPAVPFIYWNKASYGYYRKGKSEDPIRTLVRVVRESGAEYFVTDLDPRVHEHALRYFRYEDRITMPSGFEMLIFRVNTPPPL